MTGVEDALLLLAGRLPCKFNQTGTVDSSFAFLTTSAAITKIVELEADRDQHRYKDSHADRHEIVGSYGRILDPLREQWMNKKKEVAAEIQLDEVVTNIDLLNDIKHGGLVVEEEIARFREMEKDGEAVVKLAVVPSRSISGLDIPQVSEDSVASNQAGPSFKSPLEEIELVFNANDGRGAEQQSRLGFTDRGVGGRNGSSSSLGPCRRRGLSHFYHLRSQRRRSRRS
ncbi:hypothetical protein Rs2_27591 [Raphanus sativus]|nr:hypothetical protein Rs2_27591 [Raphanus sativus]